MGMKRGFCLLFACIAIFSCISAQAAAADIGEQAAEIAEPRATGGAVDKVVSEKQQ